MVKSLEYMIVQRKQIGYGVAVTTSWGEDNK